MQIVLEKNLPNCQQYNSTHPSAPRRVRVSVGNSLLHPNLPFAHILSLRHPCSSVGVGWLAYSGMRIATGEDCRRTRVEVSLSEVRLEAIVPARDPILRLQLVPHSAILTLSSQQRAHLSASVGFPARAFSPPPRSELFPPPIAFAFPTIEHPIPQSFVFAPGEDLRSFDPLRRNDVQVAVCVAVPNNRDRSLHASTSNLRLRPLHLVRLRELGRIPGEIAPVVRPSLMRIFLLLPA